VTDSYFVELRCLGTFINLGILKYACVIKVFSVIKRYFEALFRKTHMDCCLLDRLILKCSNITSYRPITQGTFLTISLLNFPSGNSDKPLTRSVRTPSLPKYSFSQKAYTHCRCTEPGSSAECSKTAGTGNSVS